MPPFAFGVIKAFGDKLRVTYKENIMLSLQNSVSKSKVTEGYFNKFCQTISCQEVLDKT